MKPRTIGLVILLGVFGAPPAALANVGTPLMWATMLHMAIGNACIGVLEGVLLSWIFKIRAGRAIAVMILANYVSAWLGWALWLPQAVSRLEFTLDNAWGRMWGLVAVAYVLTLVFEWPFVMLCLATAPRWFKRSLPACLLVQTASYVLIAGWYWMASGTSLYTRISVVPLSEMQPSGQVLVYYIGADDGTVYRRVLTAALDEQVLAFQSTSDDDCLYLQKSQAAKDSWEIVAFRAADGHDHSAAVVAASLPDAVVAHFTEDQSERRGGSGSFQNFGDVPALGNPGKNSWQFHSGFWPIAGLRGENSRTGKQIQFCLETPFLNWHVRSATQLPDGQVVFQLGHRQICLFDPETKRIALVANGRGPVAVLNSGSDKLEPAEVAADGHGIEL